VLELRRELAESRSTAAAHAQELSAQREQMRALRHERDAAQSQVIPWWLRRLGRTASDVSGWTQRPWDALGLGGADLAGVWHRALTDIGAGVPHTRVRARARLCGGAGQVTQLGREASRAYHQQSQAELVRENEQLRLAAARCAAAASAHVSS
jgi:hypothetical protein